MSVARERHSHWHNQSYADEHEAYAAARVTQFVYQPSKDTYFTTLDQQADTLENDVKNPLVLLGEEGSGKSSLLANWLAKRKEKKHKDEFLFQHYVGCSTPSLQLSHTLFRLETALKDFFQLREMKVPDSESDLRWSLNRFLAAAAKKHSPARMVIIIDCVHCLKAEGVPDGSLHWLPIDLPPCVRFIISTIENEHTKGYVSDLERAKHKTFVEITRRGYSVLKLDKISVPICNHIIGDYVKLHDGQMDFTEHQQFKIVTAPAAIENPMFLRSLLQSLRLAKLITNTNLDALLESYLRCGTAYELIDKCLNVCNEYLTKENQECKSIEKILGNMFSVVFASRNGLTEAEIWGILKLVTRDYPSENLARKLFTIVRDFTMIVNGLHTFSHKIYREVVYAKYVVNDDTLKRWHFVMARFFGELPPCARKIVALPHHLEFAGAWSKVKNCLTDIDMFHLWWTPPFKKEFLSLWASLTTRINDEGDELSRPTYDVVEEYVKSLDEYRYKKHPKDEEVANIILEIGDFLIEFATLGHEESADVPALFHPEVPAEDLRSIGVPYIKLESDGKNTYGALQYPVVFTALGPVDEKAAFDNPKAYDDLPICSAYFFHRWMWIQYPYIALGSCDNRYQEGITLAKSGMNLSTTMSKSQTRSIDDTNKSPTSITAENLKHKDKFLKADTRPLLVSKSLSAIQPLPQIKFIPKASRTIRRKPKNDLDSGNAIAEAFMQRLLSLSDEVQTYRDEFDFLAHTKLSRVAVLAELKGQMEELSRSGDCVSQYSKELSSIISREDEASVKAELVQAMNRNLQSLYMVCQRHPAHVPALVDEIQFKLDQDKFIIEEIKKRLWEQNFEMGYYLTTFRNARSLIQKGNDMRNKLISNREDVKSDLDSQRVQTHNDQTKKIGKLSPQSIHSFDGDLKSERNKLLAMSLHDTNHSNTSWEESWSIISSRTGILEPEVFFQRFQNAGVLEKQIESLKCNGEYRVESLKDDLAALELELDDFRHDIMLREGVSAKDKLNTLSDMQQTLRHKKEVCEALEELEQKIDRGFDHISELLGVPLREKGAQITDVIMDVETVLDTLMEEREKQTQSQVPGGALETLSQGSRIQNSGIITGPEMHNRPSELEFVLTKYEKPTTRLPYKLPSRSQDVLIAALEDDAPEEEDTFDRDFIKNRSTLTLKSKSKKKVGTSAHITPFKKSR